MSTTTNNTHDPKQSVCFDHHVRFNCNPLPNVIEDSVYDGNISSSSSQLSGWGSAVSRKSYVCLTSLVREDSSPSNRSVSPPPIGGEGWGYFVDTKDFS